ncbi:hypothetical protein [Alienimonas sp. DA493]|uniref:hypothetical protein n=1 Tax=Alienimonas sp. DA493 TaxID=3373605 RepID=UPI0037542F21
MKRTLAERYERGSRTHVLDLLEDARGRNSLTSALRGTGLRPAAEPHFRPAGRGRDVTEYELEDYLGEVGPPLPALEPTWWVRHREGAARGPVWDLLAVLEPVGGGAPVARPGLLLVDAKAHASEFRPEKGMSEPEDSDRSRENARRIRKPIKEAERRLNVLNRLMVRFPTERHYHLVSRLAYACEAASRGCAAVLMLLGFTGDTTFPDHFRGGPHWQREVGAYLHGVLPLWTLDRPLPVVDGEGRERGTVRVVAPSIPAAPGYVRTRG